MSEQYSIVHDYYYTEQKKKEIARNAHIGLRFLKDGKPYKVYNAMLWSFLNDDMAPIYNSSKFLDGTQFIEDYIRGFEKGVIHCMIELIPKLTAREIARLFMQGDPKDKRPDYRRPYGVWLYEGPLSFVRELIEDRYGFIAGIYYCLLQIAEKQESFQLMVKALKKNDAKYLWDYRYGHDD